MSRPQSLTETEAARARQVALLLGTHDHSSPVAVVAWLGAMQAQDVASGMWSVGVRVPGLTVADVEAAFESGAILRTWPMRGTIHIVPAEDTRWMLDLLATRTLAATVKRRSELGLDPDSLDRVVDVLMDALAGGVRLTRSEALATLNASGIPCEGQAGYHALSYAALVGAICIGPYRGKQQTFVRLDEWAPRQRTLGREEALIDLCWRFFRSHGPATVADFAGWTGLTLTDCRRAVGENTDRLTAVQVDGVEMLMSRIAADSVPTTRQPATALPGFDEFILGYKDRRIQVPPGHLASIVPGGNGVFRSTICIDGRAVATWTREIRRDRVDVRVHAFDELTRSQSAAADVALEAYGSYLGLPVSRS